LPNKRPKATSSPKISCPVKFESVYGASSYVSLDLSPLINKSIMIPFSDTGLLATHTNNGQIDSMLQNLYSGSKKSIKGLVEELGYSHSSPL